MAARVGATDGDGDEDARTLHAAAWSATGATTSGAGSSGCRRSRGTTSGFRTSCSASTTWSARTTTSPVARGCSPPGCPIGRRVPGHGRRAARASSRAARERRASHGTLSAAGAAAHPRSTFTPDDYRARGRARCSDHIRARRHLPGQPVAALDASSVLPCSTWVSAAWFSRSPSCPRRSLPAPFAAYLDAATTRSSPRARSASSSCAAAASRPGRSRARARAGARRRRTQRLRGRAAGERQGPRRERDDRRRAAQRPRPRVRDRAR